MLLSVLDYAMVDSGRTSQEALRETVALGGRTPSGAGSG